MAPTKKTQPQPKSNGRPINRETGKAGLPATKDAVLLVHVDPKKMSKSRNRIFCRLDGDQQKFCTSVSTLVARSTASSVLQIHEIGMLVAEFRKHKRYGNSDMKKMAFVIFGAESGYARLMTARKIAETWTAGELSKMVREAASQGNEITEGHLRYLVALNGPLEHKRKKLEAQLVSPGLSVQKLRELARGKASRPENSTPLTILRRFYHSLVNSVGAFDDTIRGIDNLSSTPTAEIPADMMDVVDATLDRLAEQEKKLHEAQERLQTLRDSVRRLEQAPDEPEQADDDDQPSDDLPDDLPEDLPEDAGPLSADDGAEGQWLKDEHDDSEGSDDVPELDDEPEPEADADEDPGEDLESVTPAAGAGDFHRHHAEHRIPAATGRNTNR